MPESLILRGAAGERHLTMDLVVAHFDVKMADLVLPKRGATLEIPFPEDDLARSYSSVLCLTIPAAAWLKASFGVLVSASILAFFAAALRAALAATCRALRFAPSLWMLWVESFTVGLRGFMSTVSHMLDLEAKSQTAPLQWISW